MTVIELIFSRVGMYVASGIIVILHFVGVLLPMICGGRDATFDTSSEKVRKGVWITCIVNGVLHLAVFCCALLSAVEPEELFLALLMSATSAMVATGIRKKYKK